MKWRSGDQRFCIKKILIRLDGKFYKMTVMLATTGCWAIDK